MVLVLATSCACRKAKPRLPPRLRSMLFKAVEEIDKVTPADVHRVAKQYFVEKTRTVAYHVKPAKEGQ